MTSVSRQIVGKGFGFGLALVGIGLQNLTSGETASYISGMFVGFGLCLYLVTSLSRA